MRTWRINRFPQACGSCGTRIPEKAKYLELENAAGLKRVRCQPCGEHMYGEPAPDVIEEPQQEAPASVPEGVRHQPSLGLAPVGTMAMAENYRANRRRR